MINARPLLAALRILFGGLKGLRLAAPLRYRGAFRFRGLEALRVEWV